MFNNPLRKYQSGGAAPSQDQQKMLMAFVEWRPKRVKEFANMQPEQIVEALNGMSKTPEGQKQVEQLMQQFQQEMSGTQAGQFKKGGKLWNFICKHATGGQIAGCGCVEKAEDGDTVPSYKRITLPNNRSLEILRENGRIARRLIGPSEGNPDKLDTNLVISRGPYEFRASSQNPDTLTINGSPRSDKSFYSNWNADLDQAKANAELEDGGKVEKHQNSKGKIGSEINSIASRLADKQKYIEREWQPDGKAVYTMSPTLEHLPSNMRKDPFSLYSQQRGDYQGDNQISIVDYGDGTLRVNMYPYLSTDDPDYGVLHGSDSAYVVNAAKALLNKAGIKPSSGFTSKQENGGVVKGLDGVTVPMTGTIAAIRPVTVAIRSSGDPRPTKEATISRALDLNNPLAQFTDEELAKAVMAGKYGNGAARRNALGDRYAAVQSIINRSFRKPTQPTQSTQPIQSAQPAQDTTWEGTYNQLSTNVPGGFVSNAPAGGNFSINSSRPANEFGARALIERNERAAQRGSVNRVVYPYTTGTVIRDVNASAQPENTSVETSQQTRTVVYPYTSGTVTREVPVNNPPIPKRTEIVYPYTTGTVTRSWKNGRVVKGQNSIPGGMPSPGNVSLFGKITPYEHLKK